MKKRVLSFVLAVLMAILTISPIVALPTNAVENVALLWPIDAYIITALDRYYNGAPHPAIDISAYTGTNVYAVAEGDVFEINENCSAYSDVNHICNCGTTYGNHIKIKHTIGNKTYISIYAHLSTVLVKEGDRVVPGQAIGKSGSSGASEAPHLHFEFHPGTRTKKVFQYYINNPSAIDGITIVEKAVNASEYFGDWIRNNCDQLSNGNYKYVYKNQYIDENCKRYDCAAQLRIIETVTPYSLPCNSNTASQFNTTSTALTDKILPAGYNVTATALYKNSEGNYWYKITLKDGTSAYVYSKYTEPLGMIEPTITGGSFPNNITGATSLKGTVTASGATIDMIRAVVYKGQTTSGIPVIQSNEYSVNATSYQLYNSDVDLSLPFQNLAQFGDGTYTLVIEAKTSTFLADGNTLSGMCSSGYRIAGLYYFTYGSGNPAEPEPDKCNIVFTSGISIIPGYYTNRVLNGINKDRGPGELIVFNSGSVANTNGYGTDIAIDSTGKVIGIRAYQDPNKLTIPNGGFVLSGHGDSSGWINEIALGQYVAYDVDSMMAYVYADENSYLLNHKKVKSGSAIGTLPSLGLEGYNFIGWSTDPEGKNLINEAYTVTQSLTLYAVWESITPSCEHINTNIIYTYLSCQEEGYVIYQCNDCGNQQTIVAPKVDHSYTDGLCIYCYQSHPDCINGHEFGAWTQNTINDIAPHISLCIKCQYPSYSQHDFYSTADYDGSYHVRYCTLCGALYEEHEYRYIEGWAASCKNNSTGLKACNQCTLCDRLILNGEQVRQEDLVIYPTHSVQHVEAQNPTCTTDGNIEYWYCTECNQTWLDKDCTLVALSTVSPSPGHVWDSGIVINGNILYTCTVCHTTQTETAPQNPPTISIESARGSAGNTVTMQVFIENNPGIAFLSLSLQYDQSVLTLASKAINGEIIGDFDHDTNLMWNSPYNSYTNGILCTLSFVISPNAATGNYPIKLIFREAYTENDEKVAFGISNGSIQVIEYVYGDVNGDEIVDGRDVIKLRQYMANYNYDTGISTVAVSAGADANGDGIINGLDVIKLRQYMANYNYDIGSSTVVLGPTQ